MLRRTIGISATAAAISIAAILPAGAQTSPGGLESYAAGAKATALDLTVFGQALTVSDTAAGIDSSAKAVADGKALLTPGFSSAGAPAASDGDTSGSDCQEIDLPSPINLAALDIVCVTTSAVVTNGNPISSAVSDELVIEVRSPDAISGTPLVDVVAGIQGGVDQLFDGLVDVFTPLQEGTGVDVPGVVDSLLTEIQAGELLARITVAPTSSTGAFGAGVAANAVSNGVIVELLPNLPGGALAVATVGSSTAGVVRDITTGAPTLSGSAAVLNITYPNGQLAGLAQLTEPIEAVLNTAFAQLACGDANPLSPVICFTLGATNDLDAAEAKALGFDYGPGTVGRETSVLSLTLLAAAPEGGIVLNVGHTAVASGSELPAPAAPALPREGETPLEKARTGGSAALPLTLALLAVGAAGAVLLRRSRIV